jgi:hypothetical protein
MTIQTAAKLYEVASEFSCSRDSYSPYKDDKELEDELDKVLRKSGLKYEIEKVECFENPGYTSGTISVAFIDEKGELFMDVFFYEVR